MGIPHLILLQAPSGRSWVLGVASLEAPPELHLRGVGGGAWGPVGVDGWVLPPPPLPTTTTTTITIIIGPEFWSAPNKTFVLNGPAGEKFSSAKNPTKKLPQSLKRGGVGGSKEGRGWGVVWDPTPPTAPLVLSC